MKQNLLVLALAALSSGSAFGGVVVQVISVPTTPLDFTNTLTFNKFDPSLGTLTSITFIGNVSASDTTTITNTSGRSRTFMFSSSVDLQIQNAASTLIFDEVLPFTSQSITLANNQSTTATASSSGNATAVYSAPSGALSSYTGSAIVQPPTPANPGPSNPIVTGAFVGAGQTIALLFDASNNSSVTGGSNNASSSGTAGGTLEVDYTYTNPTTGTPEPASMLLLGSALVGIGAFNKFRKKSI